MKTASILIVVLYLFVGCSDRSHDSEKICQVHCRLDKNAKVAAWYVCPDASPIPMSVESVISCSVVVNDR